MPEWMALVTGDKTAAAAKHINRTALDNQVDLTDDPPPQPMEFADALVEGVTIIEEVSVVQEARGASARTAVGADVDARNRERLNITTIGWPRRDELLALFDELAREDYFSKKDESMLSGDDGRYAALFADARVKRYEALEAEFNAFLDGLTKKKKKKSGRGERAPFTQTSDAETTRGRRSATTNARRSRAAPPPPVVVRPLAHPTDRAALAASTFGMSQYPQMIERGISGPLKDVWVCSLCQWTITDAARAAEHQCTAKSRITGAPTLYSGRQTRVRGRGGRQRRRRRRSRHDEAEEDSAEEDEDSGDEEDEANIPGGVEDLEDSDGEESDGGSDGSDLEGFVVSD